MGSFLGLNFVRPSTVRFFERMPDMSLAAAGFVLEEAQKAVQKRGRFALALSGGSTPRELYQLLSQPRFSNSFPWNKTHIFWGDERWTPPNNPDSNFSMAKDALLSKVPLPKSQVHPIETEGLESEKSAEEYEKLLRIFFTKNTGFDLMLLGIGPDGHTASIFPNGPALEEKTRWVMPVPAPQGILPRLPRITLTFPLINLSRKILFLSGFKDKEKVISEILESKSFLPASKAQAQEETHFYIQGKKDS